MELEHEFSVPVPVQQAWDVLLDVERIAPCMPGATVESFDGETIDGRVKVKVGPIQVTYAGTARFVEKDEAARRAVIDARAKEARGSGTANATITAVLHETGSSETKVTVTTDLAITGRPAQFGRGVMAEVGNKLLGKFADCLAGELSSGEAGAAAAPETAASATAAPSAAAAAPSAAADQPAATATSAWESADPAAAPPPQQAAGPRAVPSPSPSRAAQPVSESEPIDLLDAAGLPVLKRLAPLVAGAILLVVLWRLFARRR